MNRQLASPEMMEGKEIYRVFSGWDTSCKGLVIVFTDGTFVFFREIETDHGSCLVFAQSPPYDSILVKTGLYDTIGVRHQTTGASR